MARGAVHNHEAVPAVEDEVCVLPEAAADEEQRSGGAPSSGRGIRWRGGCGGNGRIGWIGSRGVTRGGRHRMPDRPSHGLVAPYVVSNMNSDFKAAMMNRFDGKLHDTSTASI